VPGPYATSRAIMSTSATARSRPVGRIDLLTGKVHAWSGASTAAASYRFLKLSMPLRQNSDQADLDNHSAHISRETQACSH